MNPERPLHLVIAEDETVTRRMLNVLLANAGYRVTAVENGRQAFDVVRAAGVTGDPVDLLLTDIEMPEMTGLELLDAIRRDGITVPTLAITAHGDKAMVVELMRLGCLDFIEKPFQRADLLDTVGRVLTQRQRDREDRDRSQGELQARLGRELDRYKQAFARLTEQMDSLVGAYRQLMQTTRTVTGARVAHRFQPLSWTGGDFFDLSDTPGGLDVFVADVAGHDMGASYHTIMLRAFFEENVRAGRDGGEFLSMLNRQLTDAGPSERMITAAFVHFDWAAREGRVYLAGHPPALLLRGGEVTEHPRPPAQGGPLLGMTESAVFHPYPFPLRTGERLVICTDGLIGVQRVDGPTGREDRFGLSGLRQVLSRRADLPLTEMVDAVWGDIEGFCRHRFADDRLLLAVEIP